MRKDIFRASKDYHDKARSWLKRNALKMPKLKLRMRDV